MEIGERLARDLEGLAVVFEQGSWVGGELPDEFVTYTEVDATDTRHYDDRPTMETALVDLNAYAADPNRPHALASAALARLLDAGWQRQGRGTSGGLEPLSGRYAWHCTISVTTKTEL